MQNAVDKIFCILFSLDRVNITVIRERVVFRLRTGSLPMPGRYAMSPRKSDIVVTDVTREGQHRPIVGSSAIGRCARSSFCGLLGWCREGEFIFWRPDFSSVMRKFAVINSLHIRRRAHFDLI